jgi:hypothetical protein
MASPTNCTDLKVQILTLINVQLCCMHIAVFRMKKFIQGWLATVPAVQVFRRLSLKNFLQSLTGQTGLSFCGYTNNQTGNQSKYSSAYPAMNSSSVLPITVWERGNLSAGFNPGRSSLIWSEVTVGGILKKFHFFPSPEIARS